MAMTTNSSIRVKAARRMIRTPSQDSCPANRETQARGVATKAGNCYELRQVRMVCLQACSTSCCRRHPGWERTYYGNIRGAATHEPPPAFPSIFRGIDDVPVVPAGQPLKSDLIDKGLDKAHPHRPRKRSWPRLRPRAGCRNNCRRGCLPLACSRKYSWCGLPKRTGWPGPAPATSEFEEVTRFMRIPSPKKKTLLTPSVTSWMRIRLLVQKMPFCNISMPSVVVADVPNCRRNCSVQNNRNRCRRRWPGPALPNPMDIPEFPRPGRRPNQPPGCCWHRCW